MLRTLALVLVTAAVLGGLFFALRPDTSTEVPQEQTVELEIEGDIMTPSEITAGEGDDVTLRINTDHPVELHMHGYDLEQEVEPDETTTLSFEADKTGRFEIENHETGEELGVLIVEPRQGG
jgi:plastocyanin